MATSINPKTFQNVPLHTLCFEDALKIGRRKSEELKPTDCKDTSIRFCVDGLYKWYKSFARTYQEGSVYTLIRDTSWYWSSFCSTNDILSDLVKEYFSLLKDITENTDYTDLADRMDESSKIEKVGWSRQHCSVLIPFEPHGILSDCAAALGVSFSILFQVGLGKALGSNRSGLYSAWVGAKIQPLFDEIMAHAVRRLDDFVEIRESMMSRTARRAALVSKS